MRLQIDGQTWEEWAKAQFEWENCDECGRDETGHEPVVFMGHWFAKCKDVED